MFHVLMCQVYGNVIFLIFIWDKKGPKRVILKFKRKREKYVLDDKREEIVKEQLEVRSMCTDIQMNIMIDKICKGNVGRGTSIMRL